MPDKKKKRLCQWDKEDYEEKFDKLRSIVEQPTHLCLKCGRVANDKKRLCRPKAIAPAPPPGEEETRHD